MTALSGQNRGQGKMQIIGYARAGREFDLREELKADGYAVTVPRVVTAVSRGKDRKAKLEDAPLLPNYLFFDMTVDQYHSLTSAGGKYKFLSSTYQIVPMRLNASMNRWVARVEREAQREVERYKRGEELSMFQNGEGVRITDGPFAEWLDGQNVTFRRMVHAAHQPFPSAEVEVSIFGRITKLEVDPLSVRRA